MGPDENQLKQVAAYIKACRRLVVLTGAGVSKESGIPTFRDELTGLWQGYNPMELATPEGFSQKSAPGLEVVRLAPQNGQRR